MNLTIYETFTASTVCKASGHSPGLVDSDFYS